MKKIYFSKDDYNKDNFAHTQKIFMKEIRQLFHNIGKAIKNKYGILEKIEIPLDFITYYTEEKVNNAYKIVEHNLEHIIARYNKGKITLVNKNGKYITNLSDIEKNVLIQDFIIKSIAQQIVQEYGQSRCFIKHKIDKAYDSVLAVI